MSRIAEAHLGDAPYPESPGFKEPTTSRDAARKFTARSAILRDKAMAEFALVGAAGLTADEVADRLRESVLAIRPRVSELRESGKIVAVPGARRKNASGMSAKVWRLAR